MYSDFPVLLCRMGSAFSDVFGFVNKYHSLIMSVYVVVACIIPAAWDFRVRGDFISLSGDAMIYARAFHRCGRCEYIYMALFNWNNAITVKMYYTAPRLLRDEGFPFQGHLPITVTSVFTYLPLVYMYLDVSGWLALLLDHVTFPVYRILRSGEWMGEGTPETIVPSLWSAIYGRFRHVTCFHFHTAILQMRVVSSHSFCGGLHG